jgi:Sec-independent protein translocase protein TatA
VFDLSPEKIMALLAVGLVVLGPHRLPTAARSLAQGLAKARRLADTLTQPVHAGLAEPREHLERAVAEIRGAVVQPVASAVSAAGSARQLFPPLVEATPAPPAETPRCFDPSEN